MTKCCCSFKRKLSKTQAADDTVHRQASLHTVATSQTVKTILTIPPEIDDARDSPVSLLTQKQRTLRFAADTDVETSSKDLHSTKKKSSCTSSRSATSSARTRVLISSEFTESFASSTDGEDEVVIHGLTEENREAYWTAVQMLAEVPDWECAYKSAKPPAKVQYKMDPGNKSGWLYMAMVLPHSLVATMAPRLEVDTWTSWHPYCTKHEMTGDSSTWQFQSHFEQSMAMGALKTDQNTRTRRWVNETDGFFLQQLTTLTPEDDGYVEPRLPRDQVEAAVLAISPSPKETLMLLRIRIQAPIAIPAFVQKFFFSTVAPTLLKQMMTSASQVENPRYPFKQRVDDDKLGIYAYLAKLALTESAKPMSIIEKTYDYIRNDTKCPRVISDLCRKTSLRRKNIRTKSKKAKKVKK